MRAKPLNWGTLVFVLVVRRRIRRIYKSSEKAHFGPSREKRVEVCCRKEEFLKSAGGGRSPIGFSRSPGTSLFFSPSSIQFNSTHLPQPTSTMAGGAGKYRHLSRKSSHRQALLRNLVTSLFENESITTTWAKAKETQRLADKLITLGKKNTEASWRRALEIFYV